MLSRYLRNPLGWRFSVICTIACFSMLDAILTPCFSQQPWSDTRQKSKESILFIRVISRSRDGTNERVSDTATGFIVSRDGHVITVAHIVPPTDQNTEVRFYVSWGPRETGSFQLNYVKSDRDLDVAIFQLPPRSDGQKWKELVFASSAKVPDDAPLFVLGFPLSQDLSSAQGIVSNRFGSGGRFQTTLPLNHGNSGSPVFDISGRVIGVAAGGFDQAQQITYMIPSDFLRPLLALADVKIVNAQDEQVPYPAVCLKIDQKLPPGSCGASDGSYIVANVRWDDPDHGLNVRDKPDLGGIILGILPLNTTEVAVGACASGWCPVQCKNLKGWSRDRYLAERLETLRTVKGISANSPRGLVLRNGPDQTCSAVATVPYNAQDIVLHVCETSPLDPTSTWCLLTYNQNSGWAPADHLEAQH